LSVLKVETGIVLTFLTLGRLVEEFQNLILNKIIIIHEIFEGLSAERRKLLTLNLLF